MLKFIRCFKQFIEEKYKDGMIPRILYYSTVIVCKLKKIEVAKKEEETFTLFHDKGTTVEYSIIVCQCELLDEAKMKLNSKGIRWNGHKQACECNKIIDFLIPRNECKQVNESILDDTVASKDLDYLCHSKKSVLSMDRPRNVACVVATSKKWIWDEGLLKLISEEYKRFGLPVLSKLEHSRVRIVIAMRSHAFESG